MSWEDLGLIFKVNNLLPWAASHCYVPTAIAFGDRIRIYAAFWDINQHGRLGYIDVSAKDPTDVLEYSQQPILDDSQHDAFDCDGITPLSVIKFDEEIRLYYAGWKKYNQINKRYTLFTGLAINNPTYNKFHRFSSQYIIGPRYDNDLVRSGCMILFDDGVWRNWFASHNSHLVINGKSTPTYNLSLLTSSDGISWSGERQIFSVIQQQIMGYGRSAIWKQNGMYHGLFSVRNWDAAYRNLHFSTSKDGITWKPLSLAGMAFKSSDTLDQQTQVAFPSIILQENRILMFYNGNEFGKDGLRLAVWQN